MRLMMDRRALKAQARELLHTAQASPKAVTALYCLLLLVLGLAEYLTSDIALAGTFVRILSDLAQLVLAAGLALYCMGIRRREVTEIGVLFDGFSFTGKIIALNIVMYVFIFLWSMLFVIPGIIATYRYRFALYNLYEDPDIGIMEAMARSKRQTLGMKGQLFSLDLSYLGWILLAMLPSLAYESWSLWSVGGDPAAYMALSMPLGVMVACDLWSLAVALFYLPHYICVSLDYYDAAKAAPAGPADPAGPDGLGRF